MLPCSINITAEPQTRERNKMNKILHSIYCYMEMLGRARAASVLARQGKYDLAQQIIQEKTQCCNG